MKVEEKVFGEVTGYLDPKTIDYIRIGKDLGDGKRIVSSEKIKFKIETTDGVKYEFEGPGDVLTNRLAWIYGIEGVKKGKEVISLYRSRKRLTDEEINKALKSQEKKIVKVLHPIGDNTVAVNVVSTKHRQVPLTKINALVNDTAKKLGFEEREMTDSAGSYTKTFNVKEGSERTAFFSVYFGRNDSLGSASLRFSSGSRIKVCSNTIMSFVDSEMLKELQKGEKVAMPIPNYIRTFHTTNIEQRVAQRIEMMMKGAIENSMRFDKAIEAASAVKLNRAKQKDLLKKIVILKAVGEKAEKEILDQLEKEEETVFGLSQAMTFVGSHSNKIGESTKHQLTAYGGAVVWLNKNIEAVISQLWLKREAEEKKKEALKVPIQNVK